MEQLKNIRDIVFPPRETITKPSQNELIPEVYFGLLSLNEQEHMHQFLGDLFRRITTENNNHALNCAAIGVGSIVKPEEERLRDPQDIDIRLLPSSRRESAKRYEELYKLNNFLQRMALSASANTGVCTIEPPAYESDNPTFQLKKDGARPIHVILPDEFSPPIQDHLTYEREKNNHFSLLIHPDSVRSQTLPWYIPPVPTSRE